MKDMKVDAKKDAKAKVRIPEDTKLRIGEVNQGNGKQHEIVEFDKLGQEQLDEMFQKYND